MAHADWIIDLGPAPATTAAGSSSRAHPPTSSPPAPPSPVSTSRPTWAPDRGPRDHLREAGPGLPKEPIKTGTEPLTGRIRRRTTTGRTCPDAHDVVGGRRSLLEVTGAEDLPARGVRVTD